MSLEEHHKFILDAMDRQNAIARKFVAELEAENARLKAECQARQAENSVLAVECDSLKAEVERLDKMKQDLFDSNDQQVKHIERLTKAGDEMALEFQTYFPLINKMALVDDWNAAKEVQS